MNYYNNYYTDNLGNIGNMGDDGTYDWWGTLRNVGLTVASPLVGAGFTGGTLAVRQVQHAGEEIVAKPLQSAVGGGAVLLLIGGAVLIYLAVRD